MDLFGAVANLIDACVLVFGKTGKFLNARGIRWCFVIEFMCLGYWMWIDIERGLISQGLSCLVSMCIAVYGFIRWGRKKPCVTE
jgi:hypothetical protein